MRPTRQEQAQALLQRKAAPLASRILGRRATSAADFAAAFNLERIDVLSEISDEAKLLALGRNTVGPRDGLYVLADHDGYRIYIQERGIPFDEVRGLDFEQARETVIDHVLRLNGIPFTL